MVVVVHQTVGMANPVTTLDDVLKCLEKELSVLIILIDSKPGVTPGGDMVEGSWEFDAEGSGHGEEITWLLLYFKT